VHDCWPVFNVGRIFWVQADHGRSGIRGMLSNKEWGHFKLWRFTVSRGFVGVVSDGWPGIVVCAYFRMLAGWPTVGSLVVGQIEVGEGGIVWSCTFAAGAGFGTKGYIHV
jgi:hypothetical protein